MKVLISGQDSGGYGGAENFLYWLADELKRNKVSISFTTVKNSKFDKFLKNKSYPPLNIPFRMDVLGGYKGLIKFFVLLPAAFVLNILILYRFKKQTGNIVVLPSYSDKIIISPIAKIIGLKVVWIEFAPLDVLFKRNFGIPKLL